MCLCVALNSGVNIKKRSRVCESERQEKERLQVSKCECVRERVCVCVRETFCSCVSERECVCLRERLCMSVLVVLVRERVWVCEGTLVRERAREMVE